MIAAGGAVLVSHRRVFCCSLEAVVCSRPLAKWLLWCTESYLSELGGSEG